MNAKSPDIKKEQCLWHIGLPLLAVLASVLALSIAGCGKSEEEIREEAVRKAVDEGLAAEALGDWEGARAKYEVARRVDHGEGYRKLAELAMLRGEVELFMREPKETAWVAEARAWLGQLEGLALTAEKKGCPVDGWAVALEKYEKRISDAEEDIRRREESLAAAARTQMDAKSRTEKATALQGLRERRKALAREETRLEKELRDVWKEYERFGTEWEDELFEWAQEQSYMYEYGMSSGRGQIDNRYKRLREAAEKRMQELQKELADTESELQACSRQIVEGVSKMLRF